MTSTRAGFDGRLDGRAEIAEIAEIATVLRAQAGRIAELEHELERARRAAEAARALAYRESVRRIELHEELHAVHETKLWRYSARPRRAYQKARGLAAASLRRRRDA